MRTEDQIKAIGKWLGFRDIHGGPPEGGMYWRGYKGGMVQPLPNLYILDGLNTVERLLPPKLYRDFLYLVVLEDPMNQLNEPLWATPEQRREAILKTIGKWEG